MYPLSQMILVVAQQDVALPQLPEGLPSWVYVVGAVTTLLLTLGGWAKRAGLFDPPTCPERSRIDEMWADYKARQARTERDELKADLVRELRGSSGANSVTDGRT